MPIWTKSAW